MFRTVMGFAKGSTHPTSWPRRRRSRLTSGCIRTRSP